MCKFCETYDFSRARAVVDKYNTRIETAISNTGFDREEQFNFCPVCGEKIIHQDKCYMYEEKNMYFSDFNPATLRTEYYETTVGRCLGTREKDHVSCKGNKKLCIYNKEE